MTREQLLEGIAMAIYGVDYRLPWHTRLPEYKEVHIKKAQAALDYISPMMESVVEVLCMNQVSNYPESVLYTKTERALAQLECFVKGGVCRMILAKDNKWRVSVDGQLDIPFDKHEDALAFAAGMQEDGFDAHLYFSPSEHQPKQ